MGQSRLRFRGSFIDFGARTITLQYLKENGARSDVTYSEEHAKEVIKRLTVGLKKLEEHNGSN